MKKSRITFVLTIITILLMLISLFFLPKLETHPYLEIELPTRRASASIVLAILTLIITGGFIGCSIYVWKEKSLKLRRRGFLNGCFDLGVYYIIILLFIIFITPGFPISEQDFVLLTLAILSSTFAIIGGIIYHFI